MSASLIELQKQIDELRSAQAMASDPSAALAEANKVIATKATATQEAVTAPTLLNSWVNYGAGVQTAGYYKDKFGIVHLQGAVKDGTIGLAAFSLPVGYRPSATESFACASNGAFGQCNIQPTGGVNPAIGSNVIFYFSGISFRAA